MRILLSGTGGPAGWPVPGCPCASCGRLTPGHRAPEEIVLDEGVRLTPPAAAGGRGGGPCPVGLLPPAYRVRPTAHGWAVTGPDGARLLHAPAGPAPGDAIAEAPFDAVLIDPLDEPERLGELRHRGLVTARTHVVAVGADHRVSSEAELRRLLAHWDVRAVPDGTVLDTRQPPPAARPHPRRTLLLGGSRSGKSAEAESRLAAEPEVTYVATGPVRADDPEWRARVRAHRERRPAHWRTVETTELAELLRGHTGVLLIDGLGTWLTAVFDECGWDRAAAEAVEERCLDLLAAWVRTPARRLVAVSDEVGLGVVPETSAGRLFRDALGRLNQYLAAESEEAALVVAGRPIPLPL